MILRDEEHKRLFIANLIIIILATCGSAIDFIQCYCSTERMDVLEERITLRGQGPNEI